MGQTIFLQVDRRVAAEKTSSRPSTKYRSESTNEQTIVASLAVLDQFKNQIESSNFDPVVIMKVIQKIKFEKHDRAIYNAFTTWLWGALPKGIRETESEAQTS